MRSQTVKVSEFLHIVDNSGVVVGPFEKSAFVAWILDIVLFQDLDGPGHLSRDAFKDGISGEAIALAADAAICSLRQYTSGQREKSDFSTSTFSWEHKQITEFVSELKSSETEPGRRLQQMCMNIVNRGRGWVEAIVPDPDSESSD
ncbi:hypothetical protein FOMPIDRAFT_1056328 [Fomitopsis schrenkii]|uniref:DUF6532 domain-containing protein n=1 Tax=Fomitopsis schrenkii TaxID=2126942 RepID=S8ETJ0_FOMSC|nr:hypothetical protein FOMPIDRAFT_1056328 [Fomitopsis schrenkii]